MNARRVVTRGVDSREIAGIGITNQRETALIWERRTAEGSGHDGAGGSRSCREAVP